MSHLAAMAHRATGSGSTGSTSNGAEEYFNASAAVKVYRAVSGEHTVQIPSGPLPGTVEYQLVNHPNLDVDDAEGIFPPFNSLVSGTTTELSISSDELNRLHELLSCYRRHISFVWKIKFC